MVGQVVTLATQPPNEATPQSVPSQCSRSSAITACGLVKAVLKWLPS